MEGVQTRDGLYGFEFREVDQRRVDPAERKRYEIKQLCSALMRSSTWPPKDGKT